MSARIPSLQRHKPSGRAFVELAGKRHYVGAFGTPEAKAQYERLLAEWLANGRKAPVDPEDISVNELAEKFMNHARIHYRRADGSNTTEISAYHYAFKRLVGLYGDYPAVNIGARELRTIRSRMAAEGASRSYCNKMLSKIRHCFKWAAGESLIPASVHATLTTVAGWQAGRCEAYETEAVAPVADATVDAIKAYVSRQIWALIELQRHTGARPGELLNIRPVDIDMGGNVWTYSPKQHKCAHRGIRRTIYIGPKAQDVIRAFLAGRPVDRPLFSPAEADAERRESLHARRITPLSCGNKPGTNVKRRPRKTPGDAYDVDSYRRAIAYGCDRAFPPPSDMIDPEELKAWRASHRWAPNRLRHTAATKIAREHGVEGARIILGHKCLSTTLVYAERDERQAVDIIAAVG